MVHYQWKVDERVEQGQIRAINAQHMHEQLADKDNPQSTIDLTVWKDHPWGAKA